MIFLLTKNLFKISKWAPLLHEPLSVCVSVPKIVRFSVPPFLVCFSVSLVCFFVLHRLLGHLYTRRLKH